MTINDWPLNLEISKKGKIKYLNISFGVYRIHGNGLSNENRGVEEIYNNNRKLILDNFPK